jgi:hypothetical protein
MSAARAVRFGHVRAPSTQMLGALGEGFAADAASMVTGQNLAVDAGSLLLGT